MAVQNSRELKPSRSLQHIEHPRLDPPGRQTSSFDVAWSPSKSSALDSSRVQLAVHAPRAWDRAPVSPVAEDSRFKKGWKSYNLRQQTSQAPVVVESEATNPSATAPANVSPQRPVKKL